MKSILTTVLAMAAFSMTGLAQEKAKLTVEINGINEVKGNVFIALYNTSDSFLKSPVQRKMVKVDANTVQVDFEGVENGTYAFSLFHDVNENKELDKGMFGIPSEPYAFSNNASGFMGPASFEDSSFTLNGNEVKQVIKLN